MYKEKNGTAPHFQEPSCSIIIEANQYLKQGTLELSTKSQKKSHVLALKCGVFLLKIFVKLGSQKNVHLQNLHFSNMII